jgi:hypothetical protein
MSEEDLGQEEIFEEEYDEDIFERHQNDLMDMFDEASFSEKWRRVRAGLKMPVGSGPYKWARLQMLRLLSPVAAVVVPIIMLGLIVLFSKLGPDESHSVQVKVVDPEPFEELEEPEEPVIEEIEPPDPVEIEIVNPDVNLPPSEVAAPPQDVTVQQAEFDSVAQVKSPIVMKGIYGSRSPGSRKAALNKFGGSGTEGAVLRALRYLKKNQRSDGSWGNARVAMTSLAVLAYLAHGDTPGSPEFGDTVEAGIRYITSQQQPSGHFNGRDNHDYTQPIAAYALAEAYAVTKVPKLKDATIKAITPIINGQNPSGGFNYNLKSDTRDDTSYMGWCVQALKSAKMAGLYSEIPGLKDCMHKAVNGFKSTYKQGEYGTFRYTNTGDISGGGLTGVGVLCLQFLGATNTRECKGGLRNLSTWTFNWDKPRGHSFLYYMYYTTQARFQAGGAMWKSWNTQFSPSLMTHQNIIQKDASGYVDHKGQKRAIGSWKSPADKEHNGGNEIMDTILCTLMLEVYYRYLPTFMVVPEEEHKDNEGMGDDDDLDVDFGYNAPQPATNRLMIVQDAAIDDDMEICLN